MRLYTDDYVMDVAGAREPLDDCGVIEPGTHHVEPEADGAQIDTALMQMSQKSLGCFRQANIELRPARTLLQSIDSAFTHQRSERLYSIVLRAQAKSIRDE